MRSLIIFSILIFLETTLYSQQIISETSKLNTTNLLNYRQISKKPCQFHYKNTKADFRNSKYYSDLKSVNKTSEISTDSSYSYKWDKIKNNWYLNSETFYIFDNQEGIYREETYMLSENKWRNYHRIVYELNTDNSIDEINEEFWDSNSLEWLSAGKTKYNEFQYITEEYSKIWNDTLTAFTYGTRFVYAFVNDTLLSEQLAQEYNSVSQKWENVFQINNTFNSNKLKTLYIEKEWDKNKNIWIDSYSESYTYDDFGDVSIILSQIWDHETAQWINEIIQSFEYNNIGSPTKSVIKSWSKQTNNWINRYKSEIIYNDLLKPAENTTQIWNIESNSWTDSIQIKFTYNDKGKKINVLEKQYIDNQWVNVNNETTSYNSGDLPINLLEENWDSSEKDWIKYYSLSIDYYSDGSEKEVVESFWDKISNQWNEVTLIRYNQSGYSSEEFERIWVDSLNTFTEGYRLLTTYTSAGYQHEEIYQNWDPEKFEWSNNQKVIYFSEGYTKVDDNNSQYKNSAVKILQNPVNNYVTLLFEQQLQNFTIKIYDSQGRIVYNQLYSNLLSKYEIDVSDLKSGTYILHISDKNIAQNLKFVKH